METYIQSAMSKGKILLKAAIIAIIILLLMIPTSLVTDLVHERQARQQEAIFEVSSKWAGRQNIAGPVVIVPYHKDIAAEGGKVIRVKDYAYFLPDDLNINSSATPQERYRGIYKVILFTSDISLSGTFIEIIPSTLNIPEENILWNETFVQLHIMDPAGLNDEVYLNWNGRKLPMVSQSIGDNEGLTAIPGVTGAADLKNIKFSTSLNLSGSQQLMFTPSGKVTNVSLKSSWPHPSFNGDILPLSKTITDKGFTARWKSLAFKRSFPQQWKDMKYIPQLPIPSDRYTTTSTATPMDRVGSGPVAFGADFFIPVNAYQKTMRSVKYAMLCVVLTFAFFFIIETSNKKSVHPFQYGLIGLALVLFYTLLLSFSEYIGFNFAYLIATVCTISLIGWFVKGVLASGRLAILLSAVLVLTYSYVFTILQLQDFALLLGSIGLFITLGVIMYFSRKIQW
jgi:inner membrane protein